ncbi:MAG TPA: adenylate/guanylate cyclase domain-containing protein [Spirochaetia bacterium]|nr:adenylate/guanylate cyclase domain-containing protein [Spirochaetia bacterium]
MSEEDLQNLRREVDRLTHELEDVRIINENTIEHSTQLENTLIEQNTRLDLLKDKMKKYLSPQLYKALVGGTSNAEIIHKRKKLTIFFSDIVNFSAITDSIESELLSDVLNQYLNRMAEIATKWGGTIDKFMGDGMMVFFGDPEYIDDLTHAQNCARMAIDMLSELGVLRAHWREMGMFQTLRVRMGINTGYCTVGNFGSNNRMEYTIVGGQVNIASRLQTLAEPDSIYISQAVFALIQDVTECEFVDNISVKGIHYPIEVYRLMGMKGENAQSASPLQRRKNGFVLKEIDYDASSTGEHATEELRKALRSALKMLEEGGKGKKP